MKQVLLYLKKLKLYHNKEIMLITYAPVSFDLLV